MINVFKAELSKLMRRRILTGTLCAVLLATVVATSVTILSAESADGGAPGRGTTLEELAAAGGGTEAFTLGTSFGGFFVFVVLTANWASDFSQGTFRTLLMKEPRRISLLSGKLAGLLIFAAAVLLAFEASTWAMSLVLAPLNDVSISEWFSLDGLYEAASDYGNALLWVSVWSTFAMTLAVLVRSVPIALGIGIAWAGPFEHITQEAWNAASGIYPGLLLEALAVGGTDAAPYGRALALLFVYATLALAVAVISFVRRDVVG